MTRTSFLKRLLGLMVGTTALSGAAMAEDRTYELLSATLDGRPTLAIVTHNGAAIAVDLTEEHPEIIQGIAAGAILSDLRDLALVDENGNYQTSSGLAHSQVTVNGEIVVKQASREEAVVIIDELPHLSEAQKKQLKGLLSL